MKNQFSDAEFWDFVDGIGRHYGYHSRMRSEGVLIALKVEDEISGNEREELRTRLLSYLQEVAARNGPKMDEIERVCGSCLLVGHWGVRDDVPTISRFLKSRFAMPPLAAIDSLDMLMRAKS